MDNERDRFEQRIALALIEQEVRVKLLLLLQPNPSGAGEETIRNFISARIMAKNEICFVQKRMDLLFPAVFFYERSNS